MIYADGNNMVVGMRRGPIQCQRSAAKAPGRAGHWAPVAQQPPPASPALDRPSPSQLEPRRPPASNINQTTSPLHVPCTPTSYHSLWPSGSQQLSVCAAKERCISAPEGVQRVRTSDNQSSVGTHTNTIVKHRLKCCCMWFSLFRYRIMFRLLSLFIERHR